MELDKENNNSAYYFFNDGIKQREDGYLRIDKHDFDKSEIIKLPESMNLNNNDVLKGMHKVIRLYLEQGEFPFNVTRAY